jgi:hypothetical protein
MFWMFSNVIVVSWMTRPQIDDFDGRIVREVGVPEMCLLKNS